jgi:hypothetical protein
VAALQVVLPLPYHDLTDPSQANALVPIARRVTLETTSQLLSRTPTRQCASVEELTTTVLVQLVIALATTAPSPRLLLQLRLKRLHRRRDRPCPVEVSDVKYRYPT